MPEPPPASTSLAGLLAGEHDVARPLVTVVDELLDAQHRVEQRLRVVLGINNTDFRAFLVVLRMQRRHVPVHPGDLTRAMGVSSGATSGIIARLAEAGLVDRQVDPGDARSGLLRLTPAAADRLAAETEDLRRGLDDVLAEIGTDETAHLVALLDRVRDVFRERGPAGR